MSMAIAPDLAISPRALHVEAGGTAETLLDIRVPVDEGQEAAAGLVQVAVLGLPSAWYTLSSHQIYLEPGDVASMRLVVHPPGIEHGGEPGAYNVDLDVLAESGAADSSRMRLIVHPPGTHADRAGRVPRSRLVEFLPRHYQSDDFLGRFLLIFQVAFDRIERSIDNTHLLIDPGLAPPEFLSWLANWLDLDLATSGDTESQRALIERAVELYRWKGTRRGLRAELALRLNARALIVENFDGLRLGQDAMLGVNTHLGRRRDGCVTITVEDADRAGSDLLARTEELIQQIKPAGSGYIVRSVPATRATEGSD
jgi:phage tail-like protein